MCEMIGGKVWKVGSVERGKGGKVGKVGRWKGGTIQWKGGKVESAS